MTALLGVDKQQELTDIQKRMLKQRGTGNYLGYFMARKSFAVVVKFK